MGGSGGARVVTGRVGGIPEVAGKVPIFCNVDFAGALLSSIRRGIHESPAQREAHKREAIDAAKRFLYDTLGCALGGYQVHDCRIFLDYYRGLGQPGPCTVIGAGDQMNPVAAAMLNALMVRAMDYNDIYW